MSTETPTISNYVRTSTTNDASALMAYASGHVTSVAARPAATWVSTTTITEETEMPNAKARIIKVFIADPSDDVPLDKRVIYSGDEKLTDLTDQELFFEVNIADLMAKHNTLRVTLPNKHQSDKFGREIFLEPLRIRDLKMVVVNVAEF